MNMGSRSSRIRGLTRGPEFVRPRALFYLTAAEASGAVYGTTAVSRLDIRCRVSRPGRKFFNRCPNSFFNLLQNRSLRGSNPQPLP